MDNLSINLSRNCVDAADLLSLQGSVSPEVRQLVVSVLRTVSFHLKRMDAATQPVQAQLALTDEQRKSVWWAVLEAEKNEPEPGSLMHRRASDLRAILAAQPGDQEGKNV